MMKNNNNSRKIAQFMPLVIIFLDILCTALLLMIGSRVYSSISIKDAACTDSATLLNYTVNKLRSSDGTGTVSIRKEGGASILVISEEHNGRVYETRIGVSDGAARELFVEEGSELGIADGVRIADCNEMKLEFLGDTGGTGKNAAALKAVFDGEEAIVTLRSGGVR